MQIFQDLSQITSDSLTVLTIGAFDGVHLGHERLIRSTVESAREKGHSSALVTFFPHPRVALGRAEPFYLTSNAERFARMERLGLDCVVVVKFTLETAQLSAAQFVAKLVAHLGMREMHIGYDFALGSHREGNASCLRALGVELGYTVRVCQPVQLDGLPISSTRIRAALQAGDICKANACLGRPFRVSGQILDTWRDRARGERVVMLGSDREHAIPSAGTFACRAQINGASTHQAMVEIGRSSCFDTGKRELLVHLRDFDRDVYEHSMTLDLIEGARLNVKSHVQLPVTKRPLSIGLVSAPAAIGMKER